MMFFAQLNQRAVKGGNGLRFVVFNANHAAFGANNMQQNLCALNDFSRAFAHQHVIGGDVRLTLGAVQNQGVNLALAGAQFNGGGETGAAHTGNTALADMLGQLTRADIAQMLKAQLLIQALVFSPALGTIGNNHNAVFLQAGSVRHGAWFNGGDGA